MIELSLSSKKLSNIDLDNVEKHIGGKLCKEFRDLYLCYNGGVTNKPSFDFEETYIEVSLFLPLLYPSPELGDDEIEETLAVLREIGLPMHYLPFATDWGGNYLFLDLHTSEVAFWIHESSFSSPNAIQVIAPSLSDFLNGLDDLEEEDL